MGMFDFLKKSSDVRDLLVGMVGSLLKAKAENYADEQIIEILGGLRNQGYAEEMYDHTWVVSFVVDRDETPEQKIQSMVDFLRAFNKAVTWEMKHGGPYPKQE